ncbi:hypothetical protein HA402_005094 [Bradysia odoriphaga]|nr:hypothetical protein HA402_005094 [Bradysia odoriphaga]
MGSTSLFVWCTNHSVSNDLMECNSYDAIFLDKKLEKNINQFVVKNGFADYDPETEHLADIEVDWCDLQFANEEDWDEYHQLEEFVESLLKSSKENQQPAILDSAEESDKMSSMATAMPDLIPKTTVDDPFTGTSSQSTTNANCRLESTAEMPYITWKQTESIVQLAISAPEVKDYSLKVGSRFVHFCFVSNGKRYENIVNLFGCVDAKYTSHEVRGLNIVIRLMKTLAAEQWLRLEKWPGRNQFIKCVDECYDSNEGSDTEDRKFFPLTSDLSSSDDDDDEDEDVLNAIEM